MAGPPRAQDVADALALTLERQDASGAPWCPPGDGAALRRWVTDRPASLGTGIRRAVRLARLMAIADGRDYSRFLYARLTALRTRLFRQALEAAAADGRLPSSVAMLSDMGVHLREPALALHHGEEFEIDFAQMPRLAALLDILHNALGFAAVADMMAPLLRPGIPTGTATEVARALHAALNAWLSERLESTSHMLQARRIRAFLAGRGRVGPEAIDDEGILLFWTAAMEAPEEERVDGFRLYRSAAAAMLRYRQALRDAATAENLEESIGQGLETPEAMAAIDQFEAGTESWRSPLRALALPPASHVKWLTRREQDQLLNYLGGPTDDADQEDADQTDGEDAPGSWNGGLAGDERFDLAFRLTLLRADVFGAAQAAIVARLRKRMAGESAVAQAMETIDDASYTTSASVYAAVSEQLHLECLAALGALMEAGAAEAIILLEHLGGQTAVKSVVGSATGEEWSNADAVRKLIAPALRAAIADPGTVPEGMGRELLREAVAAARKVSRAGFRREERADAGMVAALQSGTAAVVELARELDRLTGALSRTVPVGNIPGDRARFLAAFRRIYLPAIEN